MCEAVTRRIADLLEAIKFSHSVFALPFALFGGFLSAAGWLGSGKLILIVLCMIFVRSAAMSYNRLADQDLDARNPRTADRALPAGRLSRRFLWSFLLANCAGGAIVCYLFRYFFSNTYPLLLIGPVLFYVCLYSKAKRYTWLSHFWLGSVLGLSPLGAFVAVDPSAVSLGAVALALGVCLWTAGFDIIYSTLDIDFDRSASLFSIPIRFGVAKALWVARASHVCAFLCFTACGYHYQLGWFYAVGLLGAAIFMLVEHRLVRPDDLSRVNVAFFTTNGLLSIFLSTMGIIDVCY